MEVQSAAGDADLLMLCEEEEEEEEERQDEDEESSGQSLLNNNTTLQAAGSLLDGEPVQIFPIPVHPVSHSTPPIHNQLKCSAAPLGFMLNGQLVLTPAGGAVAMKLCLVPGGSVSGFTSVQIQSPDPICPPAEPTPIITGVVSGEAAQKVLSVQTVNFSGPAPPILCPWTLTLVSPWTFMSPAAPPPAAQTTPTVTPCPHRAAPAPPPVTQTPPPTAPPPAPLPKKAPPPPKIPPLVTKAPPPVKTPPPVIKAPPTSRIPPAALKHKGPVSPPDCPVCRSQYKLIVELRGFMCLCSPAVAQSLQNLKKKKRRRRRRSREKTKNKPSSKTPKSRPPVNKASSPPYTDFSSASSSCSPQRDPPPPPPDPPHGKLVILVEDFYYGSAPGRLPAQQQDRKPCGPSSGPYRCIHCAASLRNNVQLMSHMKRHVSSLSAEDGDASQCPHCYRHFTSAFKLQRHLEAVHSQYQSTAKCKICELDFGSEAAFLWHMKNTHKPGEMPYTCQVCDFRSSFFSDVWSHFHQAHSDSRELLCQYCLRVMRNNTCYQQHFTRHQKKHVFGCDQCRLHFLYLRERIEHKANHRTHVRPPQLSGLKPGTKVTVRTYSVVGGAEEGLKNTVAPCKVVDVAPPPPKQEVVKRKKVESLELLLSASSQQSVSVSQCVECLSVVQDFRSHFPSVVRCSLCRFLTCCSTSYANHMISNHATCRKTPPYLSLFLSEPRLSHRLRCVSCSFSTCRGDMMAEHLMERPEHRHCVLPGADTQNHAATLDSHSVTSSVGGAFVPLHLSPPGQTSAQLSVKPLPCPSPLSSPPAMTVTFLGPRPQPKQGLSLSQLSAVLSSLCHGVPRAARLHHTSPVRLRSWTRRRRRRLADRKWCWRTDRMAEWVLSQREQQLSVSEDVLLQTARSAVGQEAPLAECYGWTVDFLLRHQLAVGQHHRGRLPRSVADSCRTFIDFLSTLKQNLGVPPHAVGSMDEFSVFVDPAGFSDQDPAALRLSGSPEEEPVFDVVLSALSDGTFLPPLLFFRGSPAPLPAGFPQNVLLEARRDGFSDRDRLHIWIDKVWRPRVASRCDGESVLMVDVHRGHLTDEFRTALSAESTGAVFIPPGCSCRLQPLNACVTPALRHFLQVRWTQLVSGGGLDGPDGPDGPDGLDGLGLDSLSLTLACWLSEVSSTLCSETRLLRRSFDSAHHLQDEGEAANMTAALTAALIQNPDTSEPRPLPEEEPEGEELHPEEEELHPEEEELEFEMEVEHDPEKEAEQDCKGVELEFEEVELDHVGVELEFEEVELDHEKEVEPDPVGVGLEFEEVELDHEKEVEPDHVGVELEFEEVEQDGVSDQTDI